MGVTQYYVAATLDGYIAEEDGGLQWLYDAAGDPNVDEDIGYLDFFREVTAIAVGASTYEIVASHSDRPWDYPGRPMFVFTHRDDLPVPDGADVRFVQGPPRDHSDAMQAAAGDGNLWVLGGGELASQFADDGLLDEVIVAYVPVVLGSGIPLFARRIPGTLTLTKSEQLPDSMVSNTYSLKTPSR
jgi:dihydrofolate reductase